MNKYFMFKRLIIICMLCFVMLYNSCCSILTTNSAVQGSSYDKFQRVALVVSGISTDYVWYNQAQKSQAQGESKSKAYAKGGLVAFGVFLVVFYGGLIISYTLYDKIKPKY